MQLTILGSSSAGNGALLETDHTSVLIDAGFSGRKIGGLLEEVGHHVDRLDAIFLTHEHQDHARGLLGLSRYRTPTVFANKPTARVVQDGLKRRLDWRLFDSGGTFSFRDIEVTAFSVPHDAHDPVGFVFATGAEDDLFCPRRSVGWAIDLGHLTEPTSRLLHNVDCLVLEANHDSELLELDPHRPWSVKQRIRGRHGHLSNERASRFLHQAENPRWQDVCLVHLSRDCNSPEHVHTACNGAMNRFRLHVTDPAAGPGTPVCLC